MAERVRRAPSGTRPRGGLVDVDWQDLPAAHAEEVDDNPWAWAAHEPAEGERVDVSRFDVTAVLVCFDAARWLSATLDGLDALDVRPDRLVAIDNGSTDNTLALLENARAEGRLDAVYSGRRGSGFGQAVTSALRQDRAARTGSTETGATGALGTALQEHPGWTRDRRWLWLLHDDAVPAPDALYRLLAHVATERDVDVTGPKLLLPRRRQSSHQLSEVGVSISGTGRRDLLIDRGEIDQGQRDEPAERLGVSTCGMLVRTAVWRDLDGLDPAVPVFRDGVEFGWRAHLNGYRVVTTPDAEMTHRQVGRAGLRPRGLAGRHPGALDRLLGMTVVAGHAPGRALPLVWLRLVLSCLLLAVGYLLGKAPGRSRDELAALWSFVAHPSRLRALRSRTAALHPAPRHRRGGPFAAAAVVVDAADRRRDAHRRALGALRVRGRRGGLGLDRRAHHRRAQLGRRRGSTAPVAAARRRPAGGRGARCVRRRARAGRGGLARRSRPAAGVRLAR